MFRGEAGTPLMRERMLCKELRPASLRTSYEDAYDQGATNALCRYGSK